MESSIFHAEGVLNNLRQEKTQGDQASKKRHMNYLFALGYGWHVTSYLSLCLNFSEVMNYNLEFLSTVPFGQRVSYHISKNESRTKPLISLCHSAKATKALLSIFLPQPFTEREGDILTPPSIVPKEPSTIPYFLLELHQMQVNLLHGRHLGRVLEMPCESHQEHSQRMPLKCVMELV